LGAPKDVADDIISHADHYGAAYTAERLVAEPAFFELPANADPALLAKAASRVDALYASNNAMDKLLRCREDVLCAWDPQRERVVQLLGREVAVDLKGRTMRYANNGKVVPINVEDHQPVKPRDNERPR
jgi:hypothetical protein